MNHLTNHFLKKLLDTAKLIGSYGYTASREQIEQSAAWLRDEIARLEATPTITIQVLEHFGEEQGFRLEMRDYQVPHGLERILVDMQRSYSKVWGFDINERQHECPLIRVDPNVILWG